MNNYRIPEIAKKYVEYDMIVAHTQLPEFPDDRTRLLYMFLDKSSSVQHVSELYSLVTSLVQMGLDTHDLIDAADTALAEKAMRSRQLKVLAGDYYSSRFYQLLSQAGQIETVKLISQAVCDVNRLKMSLYLKMKQLKMSAEEYAAHHIGIKSVLFLPFANMMEGAYSLMWPELMHNLSQCELVIKELERDDSPANFNGSWAFWHVLQNGARDEKKRLRDGALDSVGIRTILMKYKIRDQLTGMLSHSVAQIQAIGQKFDSDGIRRELAKIGEPFQRYLTGPVLKEV